MRRFLQQLSGFFFYLLGATLFLAYLLLHNDLFALQAAWWMQVADLPFLLCACLYGGISFYESFCLERPSRILAVIVGLPLTAFFLLAFALNFANVWW